MRERESEREGESIDYTQGVEELLFNTISNNYIDGFVLHKSQILTPCCTINSRLYYS